MADSDSTLAQTNVQNDADVQVTLAGLSQAEHEQVVSAWHDDAPASISEAFQDIHDAQAASDAREAAAAHQHEQAELIDQGRYAEAREHASDAAYDLQVASDHGAHVDTQLVQAEQETASLDWASHHDAIAQDNAQSAADYYAHGDVDAGNMYAAHAGDSGAVAADYGATADHSSSYSADTSASHVDTSSATE